MTSWAFDSCFSETERVLSWDTLLRLTREMLDAGRTGDWNRVLYLEANRRERIERFFSVGIAPDETELVRDGIIEILESDLELLRLSQGYERKRPTNVIQFSRRTSA
jgi:hypothetical protein